MQSTYFVQMECTQNGTISIDKFLVHDVPSDYNPPLLQAIASICLWDYEHGVSVLPQEKDFPFYDKDALIVEMLHIFTDELVILGQELKHTYDIDNISKLSDREKKAFSQLDHLLMIPESNINAISETFNYLVQVNFSNQAYADQLEVTNPLMHQVFKFFLSKINDGHENFEIEWLNELDLILTPINPS